MNSGFLSSSPTCCFLHGTSRFVFVTLLDLVSLGFSRLLKLFPITVKRVTFHGLAAFVE